MQKRIVYEIKRVQTRACGLAVAIVNLHQLLSLMLQALHKMRLIKEYFCQS